MNSTRVLLTTLLLAVPTASTLAGQEVAPPVPQNSPQTPPTQQVERPALRIASTSLSSGGKDGGDRFSWLIAPEGRAQTQSAYQLKVTQADGSLVWESEKTQSGESCYVPYSGDAHDAAIPRADILWQVRLWNDSDVEGPWSEPQSFELKTVATETKSLASFESSDTKLNEVFAKAQTDREARLGETFTFAPDALPWGDSIQLTARGYALSGDVSDRYLAWTQEAIAQRPSDGLFTSLPSLPGSLESAAGFSDAAVIAPFALWQLTGDDTFLEKAFEPAVAYLAEMQKQNPEFAAKAIGSHLGDRGHSSDPTSAEFLSLAYLGLDCRLVSEMASAIGHPPYLMQHNVWFGRVQEGFAKSFLDEDGELTEKSQTAHLLALRFGLLPPESKQKTIDAVVTRLKEDGLKAGNLGIGALLPVLTWTDHTDLAAEFARGFRAGENVTTPVALASASEWMLSFLAGINHQAPGFKVIRIAPYLPADDSVTMVKAHHQSPYGRIASEWEKSEGKLVCRVTIPPNTTAIISLPAAPVAVITESGKALKDAYGCQFMRYSDGRKDIIARSGTYQFEVQ